MAAVLMNLYVLASALRSNKKVPVRFAILSSDSSIHANYEQRYLPSAAMARKRLLDHMALAEAERAQNRGSEISNSKGGDGRKWAQIYSYSYNQSLTGCVKQLEELQKYAKEIVGEQG